MNQSTQDSLIHENEIRAALKPWRPDAAVFDAEVLRFIATAKMNLLQNAPRSSATEAGDRQRSEWLRIAAALVPINLIGRDADTRILPISFAATSLGKKLVVVLAFPFLCFLMIGMTLVGMFRIRTAQKSQSGGGLNIEHARRVTKQWWRRYGWLASIVFIATLAAPIAGWTMPLMIALISSGFAAVSLVRTLAKEKLVERSLIGGICAAVLGLLGQASQSMSMISGTSHQLLDPNMVTGVLFGGALMISALVKPLLGTNWSDGKALRKYVQRRLVIALVINVCALAALSYFLASYIPLIAVAIEFVIAGLAFARLCRQATNEIPRTAIHAMYLMLIITVCTQSYWRGVTAWDIRKQVESFSYNATVHNWDAWADAAQWLDETGNGFDKQRVIQHINQNLEQDPPIRLWKLTAAVRGGLILKADLSSYMDKQSDRKPLIDPQFATDPLVDLQSEYFRIAACSASDDLTDEERDVLTNRLMANWNDLESNEYVSLGRMKQALLLTELFEIINPKANLDQRTIDVHRWLIKHQVTKPAWLRDGGGFLLYDQTYDCDRRATLSAVTLMETYGAPVELDYKQLRSYLRPNFLFDFQPYDYVPKTIAREKLDQLSGLPDVTLCDYLQTDSSLWLAILLVVLLSYATLSSPSREGAVA